MKRLLCALALVCLPALATAQAPAPSADRLTLDLYWDYETVADPQISPDGSQIIYTRQWFDKMNDRRESSLWVMNADGTRNRFLVRGSNARWSPSGDRIVYTAQGEPRGTQVFVRYMDAEGATSQVTRVEQSPSAPAWSPDGAQIAFSMQVVERNTWSVPMPRAPEGAKWTEAPRIVERLNYRQDREGFNDDRYRHIFVVPASGGTPRQLTNGQWNHNGVEWTPDGRSILFTSMRVADPDHQWRETDIYAVAVASGEIRQLTRRSGPDSNPAVSPDGTRVAYTGYDMTKDTWVDQKIYVMNIDGSNPRLVSGDWDRSPQNMQWKADGSGLYFTAQSEGSQNLYFLDVPASGAGRVQPVTTGTHMLTVGSMTRAGRVAAVRTSFHEPPDVFTFDVAAPQAMRQLTEVNADILAGKTLGAAQEVWYTAPDGMKVQGWYITPPGFDPSKRYPMQLHIHGGPHSMYGVGFNFGWQEQAANGYVILYTNPRGSTGYGSAFGNAIMRAYPSKDYDDLMAGVDHLLTKGFVDERNMFVTGCSGGGVLTAWIVGKTDRFAAASANCPVVDWYSFVGTTDGPTWYRNFETLPWEDPSEHLRRSPLTYVGNVKTPTMLMTGVLDLRTPMPQTEQFYSALALLKVPTAMIRFNDEWHGTTTNPSNFIRTQLYLRHWFEKHSRPATTTTTAGRQ
ncbi:MAG: S9 family peptidase [Vicinamibacterales bacterium]|nr:S9 family peptidase [Vicinamibacterales bacterium]